MPRYSHSFPNGSEQEILASGNCILDTKFYSEKKKKPTNNICVIISLGGRVLHLAPSFPGSVNDREIEEKLRRSVNQHLEDEANGLRNQGFSGLRQAGFRLDVAPLSNKPAIFQAPLGQCSLQQHITHLLQYFQPRFTRTFFGVISGQMYNIIWR